MRVRGSDLPSGPRHLTSRTWFQIPIAFRSAALGGLWLALGLNAGIALVVLELANDPRFKDQSEQQRRDIIAFVAGNVIFAVVHEVGQNCTEPGAYWDSSLRKVIVCYELAVDYIDLFLGYAHYEVEPPSRIIARNAKKR